MKKEFLLISTLSLSLVNATELEQIDIEATVTTQIVEEFGGDELKSADLGEKLFKTTPSVSLIRRSGIANDIRVRGQKKDNISVTIDGAKIYGACPNRMDPPISHILTNSIDFVEMSNGPFSVQDVGGLSANIRVNTKKPSKELEGELTLGAGSFGYQKGAFSISGGTDSLRVLLMGSVEAGNQYKDGNGDDFVGQIDRNIKDGNAPAMAQYQDKYKDKKAFVKKSLMSKIFWDITEYQTFEFGYIANRSENVLYPSSKMDALFDDSNIYTAKYKIKELGSFSKKLELEYFLSYVEHPMSTEFRVMGDTDFMTHSLTTKTQGAKIKNSFTLGLNNFTIGLDYSNRNWDGKYYKNNNPLPLAKFHSIWDTDTKNSAIFLEDKINLETLKLSLGLRYDNTEISSKNSNQQDNDYNSLSGYIFANYNINNSLKLFGGFGRMARVPDAKELYWVGSMGNTIGTPNLEQTINNEIDLGLEKRFDKGFFKATIFYSMLEDYIAYNATNLTTMMGKNVAKNGYENVDATIYGIDLKGSLTITSKLYFDYGLAYQKGEKKNPLKGQNGTDMPDIAPLKANLNLNYNYSDKLLLFAQMITSDSWEDIDYENKEQEIGGYTVFNLKATQNLGDFDITLGVDNIFDKTYAVSNTYKDLVLLTLPNNDVMLMNEVGRYFYTNISYKF